MRDTRRTDAAAGDFTAARPASCCALPLVLGPLVSERHGLSDDCHGWPCTSSDSLLIAAVCVCSALAVWSFGVVGSDLWAGSPCGRPHIPLFLMGVLSVGEAPGSWVHVCEATQNDLDRL